MNDSRQTVYNVNKSDHPISIDGKGGDAAWDQAIQLNDFRLYWRSEEPPVTSFKALHDEQFLYLYYAVEDKLIQSKLEQLKTTLPVHSDRVEIFFKQADDSLPYYSLEMDCLGRLFDSKGEFGRYIDKEWNWPQKDLTILTNITERGYTLEAKISKSSLNKLNLIHENKILAGVFRADYVINEEGKREPHWISWIKPDSPKPNFHISSSFGTLILSE